MTESPRYDGNHPIVHTVKANESLSKIAGHYRLPHWHAIWLYNTDVRQVFLGDDPDVIHPGDRLFIPRGPEGYDRLLKKLELLKVEMSAAGDQQLYALEAQHWEYKAWSEMLDFVGDAATTIATFGLTAYEASKAAKVAEATTGQAKVAAQYLADKQAEKLSRWLSDTFRGEATKAIAKKADELHERYTGKATSVGETTHKTISTGKKVVGAITGFSMVGGKFLLDASEIALSFLSPTKVANIVLWATTGETVEQSNQNARAMVRATVRNSLARLDEKIERYAAERHTVYPPEGSAVGRYINFPPLHINVRRSSPKGLKAL